MDETRLKKKVPTGRNPSLAVIDVDQIESRGVLFWSKQQERKDRKHLVDVGPKSLVVDKASWDETKLKKAAAMKKFSFSRKVKVEDGVPIRLPSLYPEPEDVVAAVHVKQELLDEHPLLDSLPQSVQVYPSDTEYTIHPKNKRKQLYAESLQSSKKAKVDGHDPREEGECSATDALPLTKVEPLTKTNRKERKRNLTLGGKEISHPDEMPKQNGGVTCQGPLRTAGDGEQILPDETLRKRTNVNGERTGGEEIPKKRRKVKDQEGGPHPTPRKRTKVNGEMLKRIKEDQTIQAGSNVPRQVEAGETERFNGGSAEETAMRRKEDQMIHSGSTSSVRGGVPGKKRRGRATEGAASDDKAEAGEKESVNSGLAKETPKREDQTIHSGSTSSVRGSVLGKKRKGATAVAAASDDKAEAGEKEIVNSGLAKETPKKEDQTIQLDSTSSVRDRIPRQDETGGKEMGATKGAKVSDEESPKKRGRVKDQESAGQCPRTDTAVDGEPLHPDEMPKKWTKVNRKMTKGGTVKETPKRRKKEDQTIHSGSTLSVGVPRRDEADEKEWGEKEWANGGSAEETPKMHQTIQAGSKSSVGDGEPGKKGKGRTTEGVASDDKLQPDDVSEKERINDGSAEETPKMRKEDQTIQANSKSSVGDGVPGKKRKGRATKGAASDDIPRPGKASEKEWVHGGSAEETPKMRKEDQTIQASSKSSVGDGVSGKKRKGRATEGAASDDIPRPDGAGEKQASSKSSVGDGVPGKKRKGRATKGAASDDIPQPDNVGEKEGVNSGSTIQAGSKSSVGDGVPWKKRKGRATEGATSDDIPRPGEAGKKEWVNDGSAEETQKEDQTIQASSKLSVGDGVPGKKRKGRATEGAASDDIPRPDDVGEKGGSSSGSVEEMPTRRKKEDQTIQACLASSVGDGVPRQDAEKPQPDGPGKPQPHEAGEKEKVEDGKDSQGSDVVSTAPLPDEAPKGKSTDQSTVGAPEAKKEGKRGRKKANESTNGESSKVKVIEENGPTKEKTRGRRKRATMDEKDDGVVRKKRRVKLEEGNGNRQSGKASKSTVKWLLVCKKTATGKRAVRQAKGKAKALDGVKEEVVERSVKPLKPSIWASSKTELLLVLPELSGSKYFNGVTEGSSNFPMVMLDESTAEGICIDVKWPDGEAASVRLTLTRDFVCPVTELASAAGIMMNSVAHNALFDAGPCSTLPNVLSVATPGPSVNGNSGGIDGSQLPVVLPYDDNDDLTLEYIDEVTPQGPAVTPLSAPMPSVSIPSSSYAPIAAHSRGPSYALPMHPPIIQYDPTTLSTLSVASLPSLQYPQLPPLQGQTPAPEHYTFSPVLIPGSQSPADVAAPAKLQSISQGPIYVLPTHPPVTQLDEYNPTTLTGLPIASLPPLQYPQLLPLQGQSSAPQHYPSAPVPIPVPIPGSQSPVDDEKPSLPTPSEIKSQLDATTPSNPPPEIEILTSSWKLSLPLILISSRETFNCKFWAPLTPFSQPNQPSDSPEQAGKAGLEPEHAYVFLGFFNVVKTGQRRVTLSDEERIDLGPEKVAGRVEWTFDLEWIPGYHESNGGEGSGRPWWAPDFVFGRPLGNKQKGLTWLEKHAQARLNLLPMQLVDGLEVGSSDEAMPKGWLCKSCGKLNQKVMMRHRWCGSRVCRDNPLGGGYAVDLCSARDANQTPLALPINTCNQRTVDVIVADWDNCMRTLKYRPRPMSYQSGNTGDILKHVFTCNLGDLQTEATQLFESIQSDVCLMKSTGDSGPVFKCHVSDLYANKGEKYSFSCLTWSEAPQVVKDAQDLMIFMGKEYGEDETLAIDRLTIIGWVSSGTRKTPAILAARTNTIAMLCLGNDVVLTIVPKWEVSIPMPEPLQEPELILTYPQRVLPSAPSVGIANAADLLSAWPDVPQPMVQSTLARIPMPPNTDQYHQMMQLAAAPADANHLRQLSAISESPSSAVVPNGRSKTASKPKPKTKEPPESMSVTLVHGDMLLFSGCDFEYSIKRMGTGILVIGNKEDSTGSV